LEVLAELLRMNKTEAAAKHLDLTRGYVREGLADARQSIWALRSQDSGETTLPVACAAWWRPKAVTDWRPDSASSAHTGPCLQARSGILRVAQEAIHNVKKHAGAQAPLLSSWSTGRTRLRWKCGTTGAALRPEELESRRGTTG
jgi:signal transduction histidine kinase